MTELKSSVLETLRNPEVDGLTAIDHIPENLRKILTEELQKQSMFQDANDIFRFFLGFTLGYEQARPELPVMVSALVKNGWGNEMHETFSLAPEANTEDEIEIENLIIQQIEQYNLNQVEEKNKIEFLSVAEMVK